VSARSFPESVSTTWIVSFSEPPSCVVNATFVPSGETATVSIAGAGEPAVAGSKSTCSGAPMPRRAISCACACGGVCRRYTYVPPRMTRPNRCVDVFESAAIRSR
jgi:hypothetical protein